MNLLGISKLFILFIIFVGGGLLLITGGILLVIGSVGKRQEKETLVPVGKSMIIIAVTTLIVGTGGVVIYALNIL